MADCLAVAPSEIDLHEQFKHYGLSSKEAVGLSGDLEAWLKRPISPTVLWNYPCIAVLAEHLAGQTEEQHPLPRATPVREQSLEDAIAIIGLGCRFPGAENPREFWDILVKGVDAISEVPTDRWDASALYASGPIEPGKMSTRWGGFLDHLDQFDPQFFAISPREAIRIDPQQRLLLEVAWEALEHAGQAPDKLAGSKTGVFVGISHSDYAWLQIHHASNIDAYFASGFANSIAANRLSYFLDLKGPSLSVDTACSSSLVALHLACQSLRSHESHLALAGGVNVMLSPQLTIGFSQAQMMARDGHCKTFDSAADGYVRGEGCGVIVLKRLSDALQAGDTVLAVIKGSAINQDGHSNGLTAPSGLAQQEVIRSALQAAHVSPAQISYVEAHGTGTPLGDPIEMEALSAVLGEGRPTDQPCIVGSVKTNIGHLEAAAGMAGIIKVVLSLIHRYIPSHLHLREINPHIPLHRLSIPTTGRPWQTKQGPRLAGISSFGFGGTNAHVILEEAPVPNQQPANQERPYHLFCLSAQTETALQSLAQRHLAYLDQQPASNLRDLCFTINAGRAHFRYRLSGLIENVDQMKEQLQAFLQKKTPSHGMQGRAQHQPKIVFLFTGQGSQYPDMGRQLYETQPTFRRTLEHCASIADHYLDLPLLSVIYPSSEQAAALLEQTCYTQPALFALEFALAELWQSWGIVPSAVMGHSLGEYVAACVAGSLPLEEGMQLVIERARLMQAINHKGQMAVVLADEMRVAQFLADSQHSASIAAINGPKNIVIAGTEDALTSLCHEIEAAGVTTQPLAVSHAFHSPLIEPMLAQFEQILHTIHFQPLHIPLVSNLTGQIFPVGEALSPLYWRDHARQAVKFSAGIQTCVQNDYHLFLEIGPHPALLTMGKRCVPKNENSWLPSLQRGGDDWKCLLRSLSALYTQGVTVDWNGFDRDYPRRRLPLPTYPFERKRYWITSTEEHPDDATTVEHAQSAYRPQKILRSAVLHPVNGTGKEMPSMLDQSSYTLSPTHNTARKMTILDNLTTIVAKLLGSDPTLLDPHTPFLEMGADSLILLEAIRTIQATFQVPLAIRDLFENLMTLDILAAYIDQQLPATAPKTVEAARPVPVTPILSEGTQTEPLPSAFPATSAPVYTQESLGQETGLQQLMMRQLSLVSEVITQQLGVLRSAPSVTSTKTTVEEIYSNPPATLQATKIAAPSADQSARKPKTIVQTQTSVPSTAQPYVAYQSINPGTLNSGLTSQQREHLQQLIAEYTQKTAETKRQTQAARSVLADNRASAGFRFSIKEMLYPLIAQHAQGAHVLDIDGNEYIDFTMGFGVHLFGHGAPFLAEALLHQIQTGIPLGPQSPLAGRVAKLIHEITGVERVSFCNSGTEAIMTALRLARTVTGRRKIALFAGSYHGTFDGVLARLAEIDGNAGVPMAPGVLESMVADVMVLEYGQPESLRAIEAHQHELAAVLIEPVQSRHPDIQPQAFLQEARQITQQADIALIFDEVITGFRLHIGGAQAWFGIKADLVTYGKIVGGGMPIGVVAGSARFMNAVDGGMWQYGDASYPSAQTTFFAGTFCKHPLAMAAAVATLEKLQQAGNELQTRLNERTARLASTLNAFFKEEEIPLHVVYCGSLFRFAYSGNMDIFFYHLLNRGVYIWEGKNCFLSTAHSDDDLDRFVRVVKESIARMQEGGFLAASRQQKALPVSSQRNPLPTRAHTNEHVASQETAFISSQTFSADEEKDFALTPAQRQLWALAQIDEAGSQAYNEVLVLEFYGSLDLAALNDAVQLVVQRHEALRTGLTDSGERQSVVSDVSVALLIEDIAQTGSSFCEQAWIREKSLQPFDLAQAPLVRFHLLRCHAQRSLFVIVAHHIVIDGWSLQVMVKEISAYYCSRRRDASSDTLPKAMQFREYLQHLEQQSLSPQWKADEAYWLSTFADGTLPALLLPTDRPRSSLPTYRGSRISTTIEASSKTGLTRLGLKHGCTGFMTLFAAYTAFLHRISGQNDLVVGVPVAARNFASSEQLVGYCINVLPLRSTLADQSPFSTYLTQIRGVIINAFEHQNYALADFVHKIPGRRDNAQLSLINTVFSMDRPFTLPTFDDLTVQVLPAPLAYAKFELSMNIIELDGQWCVDLDYNTDLFDQETIHRFSILWQTFLSEAIAHPDWAVGRIPLLPAEMHRQLVTTWNATDTAYQPTCIHQLFEEQVACTPDAIAVVFDDQHLSFDGLNRRTNRLASALRLLGIKPDTLVGICLDRSVEMLVCVLGVLKAGGAYVPLDPSYPAERLAWMIEDAQIKTLLTTRRHTTSLAFCTAQKICIDDGFERFALKNERNLPCNTTCDHLAYMIYTSGSTGKPKGVLVSHRGLKNLAQAQIQAFEVQSTSRVLQFASFSFDASVSEIFMALLAGAPLCFGPSQMERAGEGLFQVLREQAITTITLPPSIVATLPQGELPDLCTLVVAGESCTAEIIAPWTRQALVCDAYGPTETTVCATIARQCQGDTKPSIGTPMANIQVYLLDSFMQPVPIGVIGEIYIGGVGLARGYHHLPGLTAEKFVPHPFSYRPGARLYRTGDLARYLPNGSIDYIGRGDHQVKIYGHRIEISEIESMLSSHPQVNACLVTTSADASGSKRLVAYVIAKPDMQGQGESSLASSQLRQFLQERLPIYMVPAQFILLEEFPLTPNGKVDRQRLPSPQMVAGSVATEGTAPSTHLEEQLALIWQNVLDVANVNVESNFFDLGGDSIRSIQVVIQARTLGISLTARDLFHAPTIAQLAQMIQQTSQQVQHTIQSEPEAGPVPLTPIQHWFVQLTNPPAQQWNQSLLLGIRGLVQQNSLQKALDWLPRQHAALRLQVEQQSDGSWEQHYAQHETSVPLRVVHIVAQADMQAVLEQEAEQMQKALNLQQGPLLRALLLEVEGQPESWLQLTAHHWAIDAVSWRFVLEDLELAYTQLKRGEAVQLAQRSSSYQAWGRFLQQYSQSAHLQEQRDYWRQVVSKPQQEWPVETERGSRKEGMTKTVQQWLSPEQTRQLQEEVLPHYHCQLQEVLLSAVVAMSLSWSVQGAEKRWARREGAVAIDLEGHGREELSQQVDVSRTVGWFTSLYPMRIEVPATLIQGVVGDRGKMGEVLKLVKEQLRDVPDHGIGYGILRYLSEQESERQELCGEKTAPVLLNYLGHLQETGTSGWVRSVQGGKGRERDQQAERAYEIEIDAWIEQGRICLNWSYSQQRYRRKSIEQMGQWVQEALRDLIDIPSASPTQTYIPSDFPTANISQEELDDLLAELSNA